MLFLDKNHNLYTFKNKKNSYNLYSEGKSIYKRTPLSHKNEINERFISKKGGGYEWMTVLQNYPNLKQIYKSLQPLEVTQRLNKVSKNCSKRVGDQD